jgi:preprotein translocase subunit YajC
MPVANHRGLCFLNCPFFGESPPDARSRFRSYQMVAPIFILAQASPPQSPGGGLGFFVPLIFIFVIMYFVMIRPQSKRQTEQKRMIASLKTGDRVVTNAGIHGLIANLKETTVVLKVADNVKIEMEKSAITSVLKES